MSEHSAWSDPNCKVKMPFVAVRVTICANEDEVGSDIFFHGESAAE